MNVFRFDFTFSPPLLALASHYLIQMSSLAFLLLLHNGGKTFMKSSWDMFVCFCGHLHRGISEYLYLNLASHFLLLP